MQIMIFLFFFLKNKKNYKLLFWVYNLHQYYLPCIGDYKNQKSFSSNDVSLNFSQFSMYSQQQNKFIDIGLAEEI